MGGGAVDYSWDPYGVGGEFYPPCVYHPGAPVYDVHGSKMGREDLHAGDDVEPIPGTATSAPLDPVQVDELVPVSPVAVSSLGSGHAAATKIQALYRGYAVRKTEPLKHLKVIKKVQAELVTLVDKFFDNDQEKLHGDAQERLRWTEDVMALLLRLDTLHGVHPDVRVIRKALATDIIWFQEMVDAVPVGISESGGEDNAPSRQVESSPGVAKGEAEVIGAFARDGLEDMDTENSSAGELSDVDQDSVVEVREGRDITTDNSTSGALLEHVGANDQVMDSATCCPDEELLPGPVNESMSEEGFVLVKHGSSEAPQDVESRQERAECTGRGDGSVIPAGSLGLACESFQVGQPDDNVSALSDHALLLHVLEENRKLKDVLGEVLQWGKQQNDVIHNLVGRIEQLEQPPAELLHGEEDGRNQMADPRSEAEGHRSGTGSSRHHLGNFNPGEWVPAESLNSF